MDLSLVPVIFLISKMALVRLTLWGFVRIRGNGSKEPRAGHLVDALSWISSFQLQSSRVLKCALRFLSLGLKTEEPIELP